MTPMWTRIIQGLGDAGLQIWGVADGREHQDVLPGCQSVVVIGNGGRALWDGLESAIREDSTRLTGEDHPLDAHVWRLVQAQDPAPDASRRWIRAAADETTMVAFRSLAVRAGLGHPSRLGLLLHPEYGPWVGLRLACFTTESLPLSGPLSGPSPCDPCPAPCVSACPAGAIGPGKAGGLADSWDVQICANFHRSSNLCASTCHSRVACPEGAAHAYGERQLTYHNNRPAGRPALAAAVGVVGDVREGVGPHWGDWDG